MRLIDKENNIDIVINEGEDLVLPVLAKAFPGLEAFEVGYIGAAGPEEMELLSRPGVKLYLARTRMGLTQKELAERSGVRRESISAIETGRRSLGVNVAKKLAAALSVGYSSLL